MGKAMGAGAWKRSDNQEVNLKQVEKDRGGCQQDKTHTVVKLVWRGQEPFMRLLFLGSILFVSIRDVIWKIQLSVCGKVNVLDADKVWALSAWQHSMLQGYLEESHWEKSLPQR